jgi:cholesterol transport system auxiliary component
VTTPFALGRSLSRAALAVALAAAVQGCALTSKSDSVVLRYFSPEAARARTTGAGHEAEAIPTVTLRLGRVSAARYLKEKIAYRDSAYELGYYDDLRWTERPDAYMRRALRGALFEEHRAHQIVSGPGLTVDVELDAFEEIKTPHHAGRVGVTWSLRNDQVVLAEESFVVERTFTSPGPDATPAVLVAALSGALDEAVTRIVERVLQAAR